MSFPKLNEYITSTDFADEAEIEHAEMIKKVKKLNEKYVKRGTPPIPFNEDGTCTLARRQCLALTGDRILMAEGLVNYELVIKKLKKRIQKLK